MLGKLYSTAKKWWHQSGVAVPMNDIHDAIIFSMNKLYEIYDSKYFDKRNIYIVLNISYELLLTVKETLQFYDWFSKFNMRTLYSLEDLMTNFFDVDYIETVRIIEMNEICPVISTHDSISKECLTRCWVLNTSDERLKKDNL